MSVTRTPLASQREPYDWYYWTDLEALDRAVQAAAPDQEALLDEAVEETFPASDAISPGRAS